MEDRRLYWVALAANGDGVETRINKESLQSLFIRTRFNGTPLATGTAFVANTSQGPVLLTNRHNVTGRDQNTGNLLSPKTGAVPNEIAILHNRKGMLGEWVERVEPLWDADGQPLWHEHPHLRERADFVAVRLTQLDNVDLFPYFVRRPQTERIVVGPADPVSVLGFPFGNSAAGTAIWATGFVASEPALNYSGLPTFLIDCRTRQGQSGSPVIAFRNGGALLTQTGNLEVGSTPRHEFMGIYSGRINEESDLGIVWKASAIHELLISFDPPRPNYGATFWK